MVLEFVRVQVYANVQQRVEPGQIAYDFQNKKHWMPLFGSGSSAPDLLSVQVPCLCRSRSLLDLHAHTTVHYSYTTVLRARAHQSSASTLHYCSVRSLQVL